MIDRRSFRERVFLAALGVVVFSFVALLLALHQQSMTNLEKASGPHSRNPSNAVRRISASSLTIARTISTTLACRPRFRRIS